MNKVPNNPRSSISLNPRASIIGKNVRKSIVTKGMRKSIKLNPMKIFVSNDRYYNYNLERISYPNSGNYVLENLEQSPMLKVKKRESIIKEPLVLSYQKVNIISYKILHTICVEGENLNSDHICKIDFENMRCSICGCHMGWMYMIDRLNLFQPFRIDYFDYESIFFDENYNNDCFISFKNIRSLPILRKFFNFIVERGIGIGFQELYEKYKLINLYPIQVYKELGISYREMIEKTNEFFHIFADFEGANLQAYDYTIEGDSCKIRLLMRGDTNVTEMNATYWFYFKIVVKKFLKVEFEILNYKEYSGLYGEQGILYICDERFIDPEENYFPGKPRWRSTKDEVFYQNNDYRTARYRSISIDERPAIDNIDNNTSAKKKFYSMKFNYLFDKASKNSPEEVLFAYGIPYTYNDLLRFLEKQEKRLFTKAMQEQDFDNKNKRILLRNELIHYERSIIGQTRCGTPIFMLKITSSSTADETDKNDYFPLSSKKKKKNIIFFARQHPIETASSWIMEGIISNLLNDNKKANILRTFFNFYVVPMINIDGVMCGNNIAGISGVDFNRIWNDPIKDLHPEVFYIKQYFQKMQEKNDTILFFDIHSTNKKSGTFLYSNAPILDTSNCVLNEENLEKYINDLGLIMVLPKILKLTSRYFNEKECRYRIKDKTHENTARNIFHKQLKIQHCYTLESSLYNYFDNKDKIFKEFKVEDYRNFGKDFINGLLDFVVILAEDWIKIEKKRLEKMQKTNESTTPKNEKRWRNKKSKKEEEKPSKQEEKEKYFFQNLQKIKKELGIKTDWKNYFNNKELLYMKQKSKKKLINLDFMLQSDKNRKDNPLPISNPADLDPEFLETLMRMNESQQQKDDKCDLSNSIDLLGDLSVLSDDNNPQKKNLENKKKQKALLKYYKETMKSDNFLEKISNHSPKLPNHLNNSFDYHRENMNNSLIVKQNNLNNSTIIVNTTNNTISHLKKDGLNSSLEKSMSFNNKSTTRLLEPFQKSILFKNKSVANLKINKESEILPQINQDLMTTTDKSMIPGLSMTKSSLFNRSELIKKIRSKFQSKTVFSVVELKKVKIPIRKNERTEETLEKNEINQRKYEWKLKRPCSQGVIPINPFIKHKKDILKMYSFHHPSESHSYENKHSNRYKNLDENIKITEKSDRKTTSVSPWTHRKIETLND